MGAPPKQDGVGDYIVIWCILSRCQGDLFSGVNLLVVSTLVMILQELGSYWNCFGKSGWSLSWGRCLNMFDDMSGHVWGRCRSLFVGL